MVARFGELLGQHVGDKKQQAIQGIGSVTQQVAEQQVVDSVGQNGGFEGNARMHLSLQGVNQQQPQQTEEVEALGKPHTALGKGGLGFCQGRQQIKEDVGNGDSSGDFRPGEDGDRFGPAPGVDAQVQRGQEQNKE